MSAWTVVAAFIAAIGIGEYYNRRIQRILEDRIDELGGAIPRRKRTRTFVTPEEFEDMKRGKPVRKVIR